VNFQFLILGYGIELSKDLAND